MNKISTAKKREVEALGARWKAVEKDLLELMIISMALVPHTKAANSCANAFNKFEKTKEDFEMTMWRYCDFFIEKDVFNATTKPENEKEIK